MFNKTQRLSREEISEILNKISSTPDNHGSKFAIVISKKTSKLAVKRHFLKRRVINIIKELLKENKVNNNYYIISIKNDLSEIPITDLKDELGKILN
jgi:ribonuclease P protein component